MSWCILPERRDGPGQVYFVTVVTRKREPVFADATWCHGLEAAVREVYRFNPFRMAALVILPDHWHALIRPYPDIVIEDVVGGIKANLMRRISNMGKRASIWQARFLDHRIRNYDDFVRHMAYIRINPIKHGLSEDEDSYPWLFFHDNPL